MFSSILIHPNFLFTLIVCLVATKISTSSIPSTTLSSSKSRISTLTSTLSSLSSSPKELVDDEVDSGTKHFAASSTRKTDLVDHKQKQPQIAFVHFPCICVLASLHNKSVQLKIWHFVYRQVYHIIRIDYKSISIY